MLRRCMTCGAYLSRYNDEDLCFPCQKKKKQYIEDRLARFQHHVIQNNHLSPFIGINRSAKIVVKIKGQA
jgi:hypothetical protein